MKDDDFTELPGQARVLELDSRGRPTNKFVRLAVITLLWQMANCDGEMSQNEFIELVRSAGHEFHSMDEDVGLLIEESSFFEAKSAEFEGLFREINLAYSAAQRLRLFEMIWNVAKADGKIVLYERAFGQFVRSKLNLPLDQMM